MITFIFLIFATGKNKELSVTIDKESFVIDNLTIVTLLMTIDYLVAVCTRPSLSMQYDVKIVFQPIISRLYIFFNFLYILVSFFLRKKITSHHTLPFFSH